MARILIADDSATIRRLVRGILEYRGYQIVEAASGLEAQQVIDREADALGMAIRVDIVGGIAGGAFAMFIRLFYRGRRLKDIDPVRFGLGGAIVAALFMFAFFAVANLASGDGFRNPLGALSRSFYVRDTDFGNGGDLSSGQFFRGPKTGVFGGLVWHTPISRLSLITEYSSDAYTFEARRGTFKPANQFNYGAFYQASEGIALGLNWLYGRSIEGHVSFELDPTKPQFVEKIGAPDMPVPAIRSSQQQQIA